MFPFADESADKYSCVNNGTHALFTSRSFDISCNFISAKFNIKSSKTVPDYVKTRQHFAFL